MGANDPLAAMARPLRSLLLALLLAGSPVGGAVPAFAQAARPTVAVPEFKNTVTQPVWWWQGPVAADLSAALANELQASGDLQVVERSNLKAVLSEQELAELGIVRPDGDAARKGQMRGARYLVLGTLTSYDSSVESRAGGSDFGLLGFRQRRSDLETRDYVAIDVRVVDSTTGEVVGFRTVEGRATNTGGERESGFSLLPAAGAALLLAPNMGRTGQVLTGAAGTLRFGSSSAETQRTPAAKAVRAALVEAADYVSCVLVPKGDCLARFDAADRERRQRTRGVLQLE